jgi:4-diphosphocytidyl-2-C-methyl-D-erythritol kinase
MADIRHVRVRALAKLNLSLEVLNKRADGYHNIRTLFQTISLADDIDITVERARETRIEIDSDIPDNLVVRAAHIILEELGAKAHIRFQLTKNIPMGAGLGGGSSNAAAVLLALPVLLGAALGLDRSLELAAALGSDVPFFLIGGTAVGLSRGEELYPVSDVRYNLLLASPGIHVATPDAYRALGRDGAYLPTRNAARDFLLTGEPEYWTNDFEAAVFAQRADLAELHARLTRNGLGAVRMTGSGSTIFGICPTEAVAEAVRVAVAPVPIHSVQAVNRLRYRALWWRQLAPYVNEGTWPPRA